MRHTTLLRTGTALVVAATIGLGGLAAPAGAGSKDNQSTPLGPDAARQLAKATGHHSHTACAAGRDGAASCLARVLDYGAQDPTPLASSAPYGNSPATLKSFYGFPTSLSAGAGTTIAIVDAYHDPTAAADLATFSATYGLPCNGCFTQVDQNGGTNYPAVDTNWAVEISLDVQWAHAIAPGANILLVEANSNNYSDLNAAVNHAKSRAQYISLSWGSPEFSTEASQDGTYAAPGVSVFAAAGDSGLGAQYPSVSPKVVSVGGTSLPGLGGNFPVVETAWNAGGGGCSAYEPATAAQQAFSQYGQVACNGKRATPDVALDANPSSGVSIFNSTTNTASTGWMMVGGTSASTPMWAARSAVAGGVMDSARLYGTNLPPFHDITTGNNGAPALVGYDLATGRGSWMDSGSTPPPPPAGNDFSVAVNPSTITVAPGASASTTLFTTVTSGSATSVALTAGVPSGGPVITLGASSVTSGNSVSVSVAAGSVTPGSYSVTLTGTAGTVIHSTTLTVTIQLSVPGAAVLQATPGSSSGVLLTWTAPSGSPTSYTIHRSRSPGSETLYITVSCSATSCSYTDTSTRRGRQYYYQITATNTVGTGPKSNEASAVSS